MLKSKVAQIVSFLILCSVLVLGGRTIYANPIDLDHVEATPSPTVCPTETPVATPTEVPTPTPTEKPQENVTPTPTPVITQTPAPTSPPTSNNNSGGQGGSNITINQPTPTGEVLSTPPTFAKTGNSLNDFIVNLTLPLGIILTAISAKGYGKKFFS